MANSPDPRIWNRDMIADAVMPLEAANDLWTQQCFTAPTDERRREIDGLLAQAEQRIAEIRAAIS